MLPSCPRMNERARRTRWKVAAHPLFIEQLKELIDEVNALKKKDPKGYLKKNPAKHCRWRCRRTVASLAAGLAFNGLGTHSWGQP